MNEFPLNPAQLEQQWLTHLEEQNRVASTHLLQRLHEECLRKDIPEGTVALTLSGEDTLPHAVLC